MYIVTDRLTLRSFVPSDEQRIVEICGNAQLSAYTSHIPFPYEITDARGWLASQNLENPSFAILLNSDNKLIGNISYQIDKENSTATLGYWLDANHWNNGYMTEAAIAIRDIIFSQGYHKIAASHLAPNYASGRVMQKIGMVREGVLKDGVKRNNVYMDVILYGLCSEAR